MGRGASGLSGGGGGGIKAISASKVAKMSDNDLRKADKLISAQIQVQDDLLAQIARDNPAYNMPQTYYDVQADKRDLQKVQRMVVDEIVSRRKTTPGARRTFVNASGEATTRNITTTTYATAQKRLAKQLMSFIGG